MYILKANLVNDDSAIYVSTVDGVSGFSSAQRDAQRFGDRLSADSAVVGLQGFRVVKLVPRRG